MAQPGCEQGWGEVLVYPAFFPTELPPEAVALIVSPQLLQEMPKEWLLEGMREWMSEWLGLGTSPCLFPAPGQQRHSQAPPLLSQVDPG